MTKLCTATALALALNAPALASEPKSIPSNNWNQHLHCQIGNAVIDRTVKGDPDIAVNGSVVTVTGVEVFSADKSWPFKIVLTGGYCEVGDRAH